MVEHHTVYLAGKIEMNGWREAFNYRNGYTPGDMTIQDLANYSYKINNYLTITGPTIIGCDHGCYHQPNSHGCKCEWEYLIPTLDNPDVLYICKNQIERAEILFAYIDCCDCYGTLAEIGYAHAYGKTIIIKFATEELQKDMWFISQMQQIKGVSSEWIAEQLLSRV